MANLISWLISHQGVLAGAGIAVLDLVFALNPNVEAPDGVLHAVYMQLKKLIGK